MGKTKKVPRENGNSPSTYSTSLSPDVRRRSTRGKPIASPTCSTSTDAPASNTKRRPWVKRGGGNQSVNKKQATTQKTPSQHDNATHSQHSNDQQKDANTNNTPKPPRRKRQRRPPPSTPPRMTRSQVRSLSNQQDDNNNTIVATPEKETFVVPRKHHIKSGPALAGVSTLEENSDENKDTVQCPYCLKTISLADSKALARAYKDIKKKDKAYQGQTFTNPQLDDEQQNHFALPTYPDARKPKRPVGLREQYSFCQLHAIELEVKPHGIKLGWPTKVRFDALENRILRFKNELDMIIANQLDSSYRKMALEAYDQMGKHQARSVFGRMARFEHTLPGYYGTKGASIIQEHLANMYLHSGKLGEEMTTPQTGMEYLQQVLIPEVGFRLIREDMIKKDRSKRNDPDIDDQAKSVMSESVSFGSYLQPLDWHDSVSSDEE